LAQDGSLPARQLGGGSRSPLLFWRRGNKGHGSREVTPRDAPGSPAAGSPAPLAAGHGGALDGVDDMMVQLAEQQVWGVPLASQGLGFSCRARLTVVPMLAAAAGAQRV
jgi:hypothetical protein